MSSENHVIKCEEPSCLSYHLFCCYKNDVVPKGYTEVTDVSFHVVSLDNQLRISSFCRKIK